MKRFKKPGLVLLALGVILIAWYYSPSQRVSRQVEYWVHQTGWRKQFSFRDAKVQEAAALLALGPEAVDILAREAGQQATAYEGVVRFFLNSPWWQSSRIRRYAEKRLSLMTMRRNDSIDALRLLGTNAAPAIPMLLSAPSFLSYSVISTLGQLAVRNEAVMEFLKQKEADTNLLGCSVIASVALWRLDQTDAARVKRVNNLLADPKNSDAGMAGMLGASGIADLLGKTGPAALPFVPGLRAFLSTEMDRLTAPEVLDKADVARAIWEITGSPAEAVGFFSSCTNISNASRFTPDSPRDQALVWVTLNLADIPEFCSIALPVLKEMNINPAQLNLWQRNYAITRMERTLREHPVASASAVKSP